jgi:hypothetical protein
LIEVLDIMEAMAAWELEEWGGLTPPLQSFTTFPEEADIKAGLRYPYTCHQRYTTTQQRTEINNMGSIEVWETHVIWVYVMFASEDAPLHVLARRDAEWTSRYTAGLLLHLQHGITPVGVNGITETLMGTIEPAGLDLFNRKDVGLQIPLTITVRQPRDTGL